MNVKFPCKTRIYCSSCFQTLSSIKDRCFKDHYSKKSLKINFELILFNICDEIRRVVPTNYQVIKQYPENKDEGPCCNILFGM